VSDSIKEPRELKSIYGRRFDPIIGYRLEVWRTLVSDYFQALVPPGAAVLDLGCGYGEFINHVDCGRKLAMDLNPGSPERLAKDVEFLHQDCSLRWALPDACLDVVFSSNFFEHLPDKLALKRTLQEAARCLKPGGRLIALGPNIKYVQGAYWDFWDHFLCLTEMSLGEALENNGFTVNRSLARFLPYSMVHRPKVPLGLVRAYLKLPFLWPVLGRQFLVIAQRTP
jgi:SAM-dependent methyltransferase